MSVGKLTLLSADWPASGAVVGSSVMVADSSGADGAGCSVTGAGRVGGAARVAVSAARNVTIAIPRNIIATTIIHHSLLCITHHPKTYRCALSVRTVTPCQSQLAHRGRLPVRTPDDMAGPFLRAQRVRDRSRIDERQVVIVDPLGNISGHVMQTEGRCLESADGSDERIVVAITAERGGQRVAGLRAREISHIIRHRQRIAPGKPPELTGSGKTRGVLPL